MSECFYCELDHYHPTCSAPGCSANTHGYGPQGKRTRNYCGKCRDE